MQPFRKLARNLALKLGEGGFKPPTVATGSSNVESQSSKEPCHPVRVGVPVSGEGFHLLGEGSGGCSGYEDGTVADFSLYLSSF